MSTPAGRPNAQNKVLNEDGTFTTTWYRLFVQMWQRSGGSEDGLSDLEEVVVDDISDLQDEVDVLQDEVDALEQSVSLVESAPVTEQVEEDDVFPAIIVSQPYDDTLDTISELEPTTDEIIYFTGDDTASVTTLTSFGRTLIDDADAGTARVTLGLVIGTDVQAFDAGLQSISGLTTLADRMIYTTASDVYAVTTLTPFARTLLDDTTQGAMQTTLDVDPAGTDNSTNVTLAGTLDYLTLSGQQITLNAIDLTTDVSGDLPVADGGTGASTAAGARTNLDVDQAGTVNTVDLTSDVTGILPLANGGTNSSAVTSANIGHLEAMDQDTDTSADVIFEDAFLAGAVDGNGFTSPIVTIGEAGVTAGSQLSFGATTTGVTSIYFADGKTGSSRFRGILRYSHSIEAMEISAGSSLVIQFEETLITCLKPLTINDTTDSTSASTGAAKTLGGFGAAKNIIGGALIGMGGGVTGARPTPVGRCMWFDETLGIPIWHDGTNWIDATGATV